MAFDPATRSTDPDWRRDVDAWIVAALRERGIAVTGPIEVGQAAMWSIQLTVPTDAGRYWFKENNPGQAFEAALLMELANLAPDQVMVPTAVDLERGWCLTADHGPTLLALDHADEEVWTRVVADFAALQRRLIDHGPELAAAGLETLAPQDECAYVEQQLAYLGGLSPDDPMFVEPERVEEIRAELPRLARTAAALAAGPVPLSLEHNDLHRNNAFQPAGPEGRVRFFDFGDALWAHPFTSMRIVVNVLVWEWKAPDDDPRIARILDSYLDGWADVAPRDELRALLVDAMVFGPIHRVVSWQRVLPHANEADRAEFSHTPRTWLSLVLRAPLAIGWS